MCIITGGRQKKRKVDWESEKCEEKNNLHERYAGKSYSYFYFSLIQTIIDSAQLDFFFFWNQREIVHLTWSWKRELHEKFENKLTVGKILLLMMMVADGSSYIELSLAAACLQII